MTVDAEWARRNLGISFDGASSEQPHGSAAGDDRALARELIDFDSDSADLSAFAAKATPASATLSKFVQIAWPKGLEPTPGDEPTGDSLPEADVLIVTWTVDEGHALSRVLTPGQDSHDDWKPYTKNFDTIAAEMRAGCPARDYGRLGTYWTTTIGEQRVTLFKSDSHMSQDGPKLANADVWRQIIGDTSPKWVITTGTGGGIGAQAEVGDVLVSRFVTFDCQREFKRLNGESFQCAQNPRESEWRTAKRLFKYNEQFLPPDNSRAPEIVTAAAASEGVLTTDFFGFDNTDNTYKLQGKGDLSEMGDAVLGMVCQELGEKAPDYVMVRNVSDPEIDSTGMTLEQQTQLAADIYKGYGRWSTVCSAIVCWAIVAAL
jgi:nucleoside phosphorylase